ncbi:aminotransferase class I/II-fold pyridoxal phosphate-dependent enzyme [Derxia gummosa]|uniref:histidinol-phosphate transaminase n=1 Tax=Derxia gummosa DSM 723 TaxID=1121388 RepID=A0A8B6X944_9BURK|nr:aminotransferase class I/II-fold pyridoxal phosphate-dependent enzyme [Derxia gummosa]
MTPPDPRRAAARPDSATFAATPPPARIHGGPDALGPLPHDFSTNANACGPCPAALAALRRADFTRYPDPAGTASRAALAALHGVAAERIVIAASASEFIQRLSGLVARRRGAAWWPRHAYGDYAHAARAHGLARANRPAEAALAWVCEPSSPLGQPEPELAALAASAGPARIDMLDRAYAPLRLDGLQGLAAAALPGAWQLWSPNKALGLTGVRAAYAIAPPGADALVAELDALAPSWPLGADGVAMLAAWATPAAQAWLAASRVTLAAWKARQQALCADLGWSLLPSLANFFCAVPDRPADAAALRAAGIRVRDTASFGLPGALRLGVLAPASQDALAVAWRRMGHAVLAPARRAQGDLPAGELSSPAPDLTPGTP